jgi:hypothetical protein
MTLTRIVRHFNKIKYLCLVSLCVESIPLQKFNEGRTALCMSNDSANTLVRNIRLGELSNLLK